MGFVMEAFIGLVHIKDTSALSLKKAIVDVLAHRSLALSNVHGQCYNGASNMQDVLGITNDLNVSLQKKEQDIANAMILVKVTNDLLNGVSCLNPIDSFSNFDIKKIMRMTEIYPDDFDGSNMRALENHLVNYIIDVRDIDERFSNLSGLGELSRKLVETKKHLTYSLVFLLVKFALLLPVVIATVERTFSAMKIIKNDLRNRMDDEFLDGCIVPYVEKKVFKDVSNECIMKTFQEMKCRRVQL
ncbi:uncharacterized protein LOC125826702 [Solanum verrucosum]|uniref:uncharacterized protein LOC125826702 n=1 Tax=Solanum verrucosum TaxID=315347 RepID=UPI0020D06F74|nr:uncharacterized protein LOC125826702 [Solanum verrucosum]